MRLIDQQSKERTIKKEIEDLLVEMDDCRVDNPARYEMLSKCLVRLQSLENKRRLSPDTIFSTIAGFGAMGLIMKFEELHVLTTRAWALASKLFKIF